MQGFSLICPKNFDFQVRGYPPPHTKKIFFADLHDLGHERKKIKKSVKMTQFCPDPPPSVKFHTFFFFFRVRTSLNDTKNHYTRMNCNIDRSFIEIATQSIAEDL